MEDNKILGKNIYPCSSDALQLCDGEVPENLKDLFKNGMDSVPESRMTKREIDNRVEEALIEYLERLGRRRICGNALRNASSVEDWIKRVKELNLDNDLREFVDNLENAYPGLKAELDMVYRDVKLDTKDELIKKLKKEGSVLVMCERGRECPYFRKQ
jgi:hypothetical protein